MIDNVSFYSSLLWEWTRTHEALLGWLGLLSILLFFGTLLAIPVISVLLPRTYLIEEEAPPFAFTTLSRVLFLLVKNILGGILVLAGIAMLVLPGQGLLTLFIGATLLNFPRKRKVIRWVFRKKRVFRTINRLRVRFGRPPLARPRR